MTKRADLVAMAEKLDESRLHAREMERLTTQTPELSLADAYAVTAHGITLRTGRGERIVGYKMGLTSQAKREQMGLHSPIYGVLTDKMQVQGTFPLAGSIHPKIEPEVAFRMGRDVHGVPTEEEALAAISGVAAALEILDSRYVGFKYFSLPDVVADNSSSAFFTIGELVAPPRDVATLETWNMTMRVNDVIAGSASASAISGNPVKSLVQLCELLHGHELYLPKGSVVLCGAATAAVQLEKKMRINLLVDSLPQVSIEVC